MLELGRLFIKMIFGGQAKPFLNAAEKVALTKGCFQFFA